MPNGTFYNTADNNGNKDPNLAGNGNISIAPYYTLSDDGLTALVTNQDATVAAMLKNPAYHEYWINRNEKLFPKNWKCPVKGDDKGTYDIPAAQVDSEGMTIGMMDGENICANIKLSQLQDN